MKNLVSTILLLTLSIVSLSHASAQECALCLTEEEAAKVVAEFERLREECRIRVESAVEKAEARQQLAESNLESEIMALRSTLDQTERFYEEQINDTQRVYRQRNRRSTALWTLGGTTIGVTIGSIVTLILIN